MKVNDLNIEDVKIIEPQKFGDPRGFFVETYNAARYRAAGVTAEFVQDNMSFSHKGVIRGLHWQAAPYTQAKLLSVIKGAVLDIAVDIRKGSPTYGQHVAVELSETNGRQLFIPRGFAHGFIVLEDNTLFTYKCDNLYCKESERGVRFDDPDLNIPWPEIGVELTLSEKDLAHPLFRSIEPYAV